MLGARTLAAGTQTEVTESSIATTDQPVLDYLLGEAFTTLPKATRRVLLSTFNETRITPERVAVLTGDPAAARLLSDLARDGVLVTGYSRSGGDDELFTYHPLLIEMLRRRVAEVEADAAIVAAAHRRGARRDAALGDGMARSSRQSMPATPSSSPTCCWSMA